jgi:phospholipid/cholesterol/gamma-HCH transport system ATP-binding protein
MSLLPAETAALGHALSLALDTRREEVGRLSYASTTVSFRVAGSEDCATLLLDRDPPEVVCGSHPAEVQIELSADQAEQFAAGRLPITVELMAGELNTTGPVQKYLQVDAIVRNLLGATHANGPPAHSPSAPRPRLDGMERLDPTLLAIETRGLHKSFGSTAVLKGLDIRIPEGAISVVLGPSGTGKSVLLQHIVGLMKPDAGEVLIRGRQIGAMSRHALRTLRREIGVMYQDGALFSSMSLFDNVAFPLRQHSDLRDRDVHELVMAQLTAVGLAADAHKMPNMLSGGMRKRAGLARALVLEPSIVLVDEPDSGLDPVRTALLGDLLLARHAGLGGTMVVVTHNVSLAKQLADQITVLWEGKVLESGTAQQLLASATEFVRQFLAGESRGPLGMD